eukprot:jgi/Mesvir1/29769/Mv25438-RA.1
MRIPLRNQVYVPPEDDMLPDPVAHVLCQVCHEGGDDHLMLLCDRCDGGFHTFCVGLGRSVPPGDWFCHECGGMDAPAGAEGEPSDNSPLRRSSMTTRRQALAGGGAPAVPVASSRGTRAPQSTRRRRPNQQRLAEQQRVTEQRRVIRGVPGRGRAPLVPTAHLAGMGDTVRDTERMPATWVWASRRDPHTGRRREVLERFQTPQGRTLGWAPSGRAVSPERALLASVEQLRADQARAVLNAAGPAGASTRGQPAGGARQSIDAQKSIDFMRSHWEDFRNGNLAFDPGTGTRPSQGGAPSPLLPGPVPSRSTTAAPAAPVAASLARGATNANAQGAPTIGGAKGKERESSESDQAWAVYDALRSAEGGQASGSRSQGGGGGVSRGSGGSGGRSRGGGSPKGGGSNGGSGGGRGSGNLLTSILLGSLMKKSPTGMGNGGRASAMESASTLYRSRLGASAKEGIAPSAVVKQSPSTAGREGGLLCSGEGGVASASISGPASTAPGLAWSGFGWDVSTQHGGGESRSPRPSAPTPSHPVCTKLISNHVGGSNHMGGSNGPRGSGHSPNPQQGVDRLGSCPMLVDNPHGVTRDESGWEDDGCGDGEILPPKGCLVPRAPAFHGACNGNGGRGGNWDARASWRMEDASSKAVRVVVNDIPLSGFANQPTCSTPAAGADVPAPSPDNQQGLRVKRTAWQLGDSGFADGRDNAVPRLGSGHAGLAGDVAGQNSAAGSVGLPGGHASKRQQAGGHASKRQKAVTANSRAPEGSVQQATAAGEPRPEHPNGRNPAEKVGLDGGEHAGERGTADEGPDISAQKQRKVAAVGAVKGVLGPWYKAQKISRETFKEVSRLASKLLLELPGAASTLTAEEKCIRGNATESSSGYNCRCWCCQSAVSCVQQAVQQLGIPGDLLALATTRHADHK